MTSNGSLITKKVIAYAFKDLMKTKEFQKISITEIMTHADYRRQTFYDHFSDKYDLLEWIYQQDMSETMEHFINYDHWTKIIPRLLNYFEKNKLFYKKTLMLKEQNSFDQYFVNHTENFILSILEQEKLDLNKQDDDYIQKLARFQAFGLSSFITEWVLDDCLSSKDELGDFLIHVIQDSFHGLSLPTKKTPDTSLTTE